MNIMISDLKYISIVNSKCRMVCLLSPCDSCVCSMISNSDVEVEAQVQEPEQGEASGDV